MAIQRLFVTKRESFNQEAQRMLQTLQQELSMPATGVIIYERYDIEHVDAKDLEAAKNLIFSEPPVDTVLEEIPAVQGFVLLLNMYQVNTINVPTVLSNVFPCSPLHLVTSFDVLVYSLSKAFSQKNKKRPSKHTILTQWTPAKQALNYLTLWLSI